MKSKLIFAPEVARDIDEAYAWYEDRRPGLGEEFLSCVEASIEMIARLPEAYPNVGESCRRALVRRFPYAIFYEIIDQKVTVYGVLHTSQHPDKWRRRR
jgi:plasmid stabilization system protein ParE